MMKEKLEENKIFFFMQGGERFSARTLFSDQVGRNQKKWLGKLFQRDFLFPPYSVGKIPPRKIHSPTQQKGKRYFRGV